MSKAPAPAAAPVTSAVSGTGNARRPPAVKLNGRIFVLSDSRRGRNAAQARSAATQSPVQRNVQSGFLPFTSAAGSLARVGNRVLVKAVPHKFSLAADTARGQILRQESPEIIARIGSNRAIETYAPFAARTKNFMQEAKKLREEANAAYAAGAAALGDSLTRQALAKEAFARELSSILRSRAA
jgi:hypothetical protein